MLSLTHTVRSVLIQKTPAIYFVSPGTTVFDALQIMADNEIGALLVIDRGELRGVVSERDYARKVILLGKSSRDTVVEEIMGGWDLQVGPAETIDHCMRLMTNSRVRHLPVMERECVLGVVSMGDLVKRLISSQEEEIKHLQAYVAGGYPG